MAADKVQQSPSSSASSALDATLEARLQQTEYDNALLRAAMERMAVENETELRVFEETRARLAAAERAIHELLVQKEEWKQASELLKQDLHAATSRAETLEDQLRGSSSSRHSPFSSPDRSNVDSGGEERDANTSFFKAELPATLAMLRDENRRLQEQIHMLEQDTVQEQQLRKRERDHHSSAVRETAAVFADRVRELEALSVDNAVTIEQLLAANRHLEDLVDELVNGGGGNSVPSATKADGGGGAAADGAGAGGAAAGAGGGAAGGGGAGGCVSGGAGGGGGGAGGCVSGGDGSSAAVTVLSPRLDRAGSMSGGVGISRARSGSLRGDAAGVVGTGAAAKSGVDDTSPSDAGRAARLLLSPGQGRVGLFAMGPRATLRPSHEGDYELQLRCLLANSEEAVTTLQGDLARIRALLAERDGRATQLEAQLAQTLQAQAQQAQARPTVAALNCDCGPCGPCGLGTCRAHVVPVPMRSPCPVAVASYLHHIPTPAAPPMLLGLALMPLHRRLSFAEVLQRVSDGVFLSSCAGLALMSLAHNTTHVTVDRVSLSAALSMCMVSTFPLSGRALWLDLAAIVVDGCTTYVTDAMIGACC